MEDDIQWYCRKLLARESKYSPRIMMYYLQQLSVLELDYLRQLMTSEITYRENTAGMTSQNREEEKLERWP